MLYQIWTTSIGLLHASSAPEQNRVQHAATNGAFSAAEVKPALSESDVSDLRSPRPKQFQKCSSADPEERKQDVNDHIQYTLPKTHMEVENGPLEDHFPLQIVYIYI